MDVYRFRAQIFSTAATIAPEVLEGWRERESHQPPAPPVTSAYLELADKVRLAVKRSCVMEVLLCSSREEAELAVSKAALSMDSSDARRSLEPMLDYTLACLARVDAARKNPEIPPSAASFVEEEHVRVSKVIRGIKDAPVLSAFAGEGVSLRPPAAAEVHRPSRREF